MPQNNQQLAEIFDHIADLLEVRGDARDVYRVRAYRTAAANILALDRDIFALSPEELDDVPGIGQATVDKILEYRATGRIRLFEKLKKQFPPGIFELLQIPDLGPKRARIFLQKLHITSLRELKKALQEGRVAQLPGFGEVSQSKLLRAVEEIQSLERVPRKQVEPIARSIIEELKKVPTVRSVTVTGSYRRGRPTVHDLDFVVSSNKPAQASKAIAKLDMFQQMIGVGETRVSGRVRDVQCDIRIVPPESLGAALVYFTGSKGFNIYLRKLAIAKGLKLNEYGIFDKDGVMIAGRTETEVLQALGLPYLAPAERENY